MDRYFVTVPSEDRRKDVRWWLENLTVRKVDGALFEEHPGKGVIPCATEEEAVALAHAIRDAAANDLLLRAKEIRAIQCVVSGK